MERVKLLKTIEYIISVGGAGKLAITLMYKMDVFEID